jgi:hypothetical protein
MRSRVPGRMFCMSLLHREYSPTTMQRQCTFSARPVQDQCNFSATSVQVRANPQVASWDEKPVTRPPWAIEDEKHGRPLEVQRGYPQRGSQLLRKAIDNTRFRRRNWIGLPYLVILAVRWVTISGQDCPLSGARGARVSWAAWVRASRAPMPWRAVARYERMAQKVSVSAVERMQPETSPPGPAPSTRPCTPGTSPRHSAPPRVPALLTGGQVLPAARAIVEPLRQGLRRRTSPQLDDDTAAQLLCYHGRSPRWQAASMAASMR